MLRLLHKLLGKETYWHYADRELVQKKLHELLDADIKRCGKFAEALPEGQYADLIEKAVAAASAFKAYEREFKKCGDSLIAQIRPPGFQSDFD